MISVITPWLNSPELIPAYEAAVTGAQVVIIDNGSALGTESALREMVKRLGGIYHKNDVNMGYAYANNQGLRLAKGEIVCFLNNDIIAQPGWLDNLKGLRRGALYGPSLQGRLVDGVGAAFLEGWCLIGYRADFERIGGWNDKAFPGLYWEDNELSWRAMRAGLVLKEISLPIYHLSNYTSKQTPGAYNASETNRLTFFEIVRRDRATSNRL